MSDDITIVAQAYVVYLVNGEESISLGPVFGGGGSSLDPDITAALEAANAPDAGNPFATIADIVSGGGGNFSGPASAVADNLVSFNGTTGHLGKDSGAAAANVPSATQKAALVGSSGTPGGSNVYVTDADTRNTNARAPTSHASTHKHGGSDEVATATPAANVIPKAGASGALAVGFIPDATVSAKGALPILSGNATDFLNGNGAWATPGGGGNVSGPGSSVVNNVALFNNTSGTLLKDSGLTLAGTNTGDVSLATIGAVPNANGASLSGQALTLQPANGSFGGVVTTAAQTIAGVKTFSSAPVMSGASITSATIPNAALANAAVANLSGTNTGDVTVGTLGSTPNANGASIAGQVLTLQPNDATHPGIVTASQAAALVGSSGTPGGANKFVTDTDTRMTNARTPTTHASSHQNGGLDEVATATPAANAIPKAGAGGTLASGWVPQLSLAQLPSIADQTVLGNVTGSASVPAALSKTQITALVNTFTSALPGAVAASGTPTGKFLRDDDTWATPAGSSPLTTKGDLFTFDTGSQRLGVGSNGQVLTADSAQATGLKWAPASGGGSPAITSTTGASGTTTLTSSSNALQRLVGNQGTTYQLPDATTLSNGQSYTFIVDGETAAIITNNAAAIINYVQPGDALTIYLADNSTTSGVWSRSLPPLNGFGQVSEMFEEWVATAIAGSHAWQASGTAPTLPTGGTSENNHIGVMSCTTGSSATQGSGIRNSNTSLWIGAGGPPGNFTFEWLIKTPSTLSTSGERYVIFAGTSDGAGAQLPANGGFGIGYQDGGSAGGVTWNGNFWGIAANASGANFVVDLGVAAAANTWYKLKSVLRKGTTTIDFYVNDVYKASVTGVTYPFNGTTSSFGPNCFILKSVGTTARVMFIDAYHHRLELI